MKTWAEIDVMVAALKEAERKANGSVKPRPDCAFCGKRAREVKKLIAAPHGVAICNECIDLCAQILAEEAKQEAKP